MTNPVFDVTIYTDGASEPNPGPSGYGAVLLYTMKNGSEHRLEVSGGFRLSTNNRMEMMAAIEGIKALKLPSRVTLYSDSRLLVDSVELGWAKKWRSNAWMRTKKDPAMNPDLWDTLLDLIYEGPHDIRFCWVKGHAGDPGNERADHLASLALKQPSLPSDRGYEDRATA